jgi:hypothetical protein
MRSDYSYLGEQNELFNIRRGGRPPQKAVTGVTEPVWNTGGFSRIKDSCIPRGLLRAAPATVINLIKARDYVERSGHPQS